jgi:hypothetical protein
MRAPTLEALEAGEEPDAGRVRSGVEVATHDGRQLIAGGEIGQPFVEGDAFVLALALLVLPPAERARGAEPQLTAADAEP